MKKMKSYESFDAYLKDQSSKNQTIIRALRKFVKRVEPDLVEAVKWGNGCWLGDNGPVAYEGASRVRIRRESLRSASQAGGQMNSRVLLE